MIVAAELAVWALAIRRPASSDRKAFRRPCACYTFVLVA